MTKEEILEQQVEALEKLLQLKQAIVEELEAKISKLSIKDFNYPQNIPWAAPLPIPPSFPSVFTPHDPCNDGGFHDYPAPWFGTVPPGCTKCGKQGSHLWTVTSTDTTISADNAIPTHVTINNPLIRTLEKK